MFLNLHFFCTNCINEINSYPYSVFKFTEQLFRFFLTSPYWTSCFSFIIPTYKGYISLIAPASYPRIADPPTHLPGNVSLSQVPFPFALSKGSTPEMSFLTSLGPSIESGFLFKLKKFLPDKLIFLS
jgi:hypothetical protein